MADSILNKTLLTIYKSILKINDDSNGVDGTLESVVDGNGTATPLKLSNDKVEVKEITDTQSAFVVRDSSDDSIFRVDTENRRVLVGENQSFACTNVIHFSGSNINPTGAGYHMAIPFGGTDLGGAADELDFGNGTDPALTLDISGLAEDTDSLHYYMYIPSEIKIDSVDCFAGSESGTPTTNFHLHSYLLDKSNGAGSGDLSDGTLEFNSVGVAGSATKLTYHSGTLISRDIAAGRVLVATIESDADVLLHAKVCVRYHLV